MSTTTESVMFFKVYWQQIDPTDAGGQFQDLGYPKQLLIFITQTRNGKLPKNRKLLLPQVAFSQNLL
ncbi:hypothetical protein [Sporosarcina sp. P34]|uniref:hypothetical protein n=1 Tax=Sporosarcina sp. P34 TaxID=2048247 RepID=UPI001E6343DB|nr:hypothetical protein [Sporosarcina sp. P34]